MGKARLKHLDDRVEVFPSENSGRKNLLWDSGSASVFGSDLQKFTRTLKKKKRIKNDKIKSKIIIAIIIKKTNKQAKSTRTHFLLITECSGTLTYFYVGVLNHENSVQNGGCGIITQHYGGGGGGGLHSHVSIFFVFVWRCIRMDTGMYGSTDSGWGAPGEERGGLLAKTQRHVPLLRQGVQGPFFSIFFLDLFFLNIFFYPIPHLQQTLTSL